MSDNRFYLNCPYANKDDCKSLGGRWDSDARKWYVPNDVDREPFRAWWPSNQDDPTFGAL